MSDALLAPVAVSDVLLDKTVGGYRGSWSHDAEPPESIL